ncbi:MAG: glucose 1-dehydrogenase [Novosphingobium sp.]|nr:glucose 1-dehydrogenase [Novosphingobium sp.]
MSDFLSKTAFVTGAGGGIGRATSDLLAREGASLMLVDIDAAALEETAAQAKAHGGDVATSVVDIANDEQVKRAVDETVAHFGRIDIAHNNAGILGPIGPLADYDLSAARQLFDINVFGVLHCMQAQIPHMLAAGGGSIVNTASVSGVHAVPHIGVYTATKHAVIGLTKAAAADYSGQGIRVNCVCPGFVLTGMTRGKFDAETEAALAAQHPIGRFAEPEEVAEAVLWLLGGKSSFATGSSVFVDGGQTM